MLLLFRRNVTQRFLIKVFTSSATVTHARWSVLRFSDLVVQSPKQKYVVRGNPNRKKGQNSLAAQALLENGRMCIY